MFADKYEPLFLALPHVYAPGTGPYRLIPRQPALKTAEPIISGRLKQPYDQHVFFLIFESDAYNLSFHYI